MPRHHLPDLPWDPSSLAPVISANTISFHHGKHHLAYVNKTNELIEGKPELEALSLEDLIRKAAGDPAHQVLFNNAAQIWNHTFYWKSLTPHPSAPTGKLADLIKDAFGGLDQLKAELKTACMTQFGSGWAWLVLDGGKLAVKKTPNAETPLTTAAKPLLTIDVWEHAYYLDHQNKRDAYADAVLNTRLNWAFAAENLG